MLRVICPLRRHLAGGTVERVGAGTGGERREHDHTSRRHGAGGRWALPRTPACGHHGWSPFFSDTLTTERCARGPYGRQATAPLCRLRSAHRAFHRTVHRTGGAPSELTPGAETPRRARPFAREAPSKDLSPVGRDRADRRASWWPAAATPRPPGARPGRALRPSGRRRGTSRRPAWP